MKKIIVLVIALGLFVAACNNNKGGKNPNLTNREKDDYGKNESSDNTNENTGATGWTENEKSSFLKDCVGSFDPNQAPLANQICPCVLEKIEKEFTSYSEANSKGGEAAGRRLALECKDKIAGKSDNNANSNWSKSEEEQWMKTCSTPLKESLGEQQAANYCSCILEKMKGMYSSYDEANAKGTKEIGAELGKKCLKELGIGQ